MKKAIGIVSFGTSHKDAELSCICPVEQAIAQAFPDRDTFRAFTSRIIARIMKKRGENVENEQEMLERLKAENYEDILLVTTHIIPGFEYEKLTRVAEGCRVSEPLIACGDDEEWMANLLEEIAAEEGCVLLVMGHGTDHAADEIYARIQKKTSGNVFVGCAEGERTLEAIMAELEALEKKEVVLMPMMLVAGDHAKNDLAGDDEDSWKSVLTAKGFDVRVRMQGLGALKAVQQRYVEKVRKAAE